MYAEFGDKGNGLSSKFLDPRALCAHLDPMPSAAMIPLKMSQKVQSTNGSERVSDLR